VTFLEPLEVKYLLGYQDHLLLEGVQEGSPVFLKLNRYASILGVGFFREFSQLYKGKFSFMSFLFKSYEFHLKLLQLSEH